MFGRRLFSCRVDSSATVKGPRRPVAITRPEAPPPPPPPARSPRGLGGRLSSDDNTCPYYVYITLMLTCNLSAVAAWRQSLCVCTEVATCEFVQYMQVCVCLCPRRNLSVVTQKKKKSNTCMHPTTTAQHTHTRKPHSYEHIDTLQQLFTMRHIVLSSACHSAWRIYSVSTFLF